MNNSISNNIRNTEFRGNQAQQGSAIFLNNSQPVSCKKLVHIFLDTALHGTHAAVQGHKVSCSQMRTTEPSPGARALLGTSACLPICIHQ